MRGHRATLPPQNRRRRGFAHVPGRACAKETSQNPLSVEGDSGFEIDDDLGDQIDDPIAP